MEGTIGEIRIFASNFAPRTWAFCQGQTVTIASNTALFSILGTYFGGNGSTTFMLPNLSGRAAIGAGQGAGLSIYNLGQTAGTEKESLTIAEMPMHLHPAIAQPGAGAGTTTATLYGVTNQGDAETPGGNFIGVDSNNGLITYTDTGTPVPMNAGSLQITNVTAPLPVVSIGATGNNIPHDNIQPSLVLYYIICQYGVYPPRS
jgi:microcystin-dependent protein